MPNYFKRQLTLQHSRQLVVYDTRHPEPNSAKTRGWLIEGQQRPQEKTPRDQVSTECRFTQTQKFSLVLFVALLGSLWLSGCAGVAGHAVGEATAPSITAQPASQTMIVGQRATFSVAATGASPLSYIWEENGTAISGANSSSYTTPPLTASDNLEQFRVVVSNSLGTAMSNSATLDVNAATATAITISPNTATVTTGASQQFTAAVTGNSNKGVTWSVSGAGCSGAACGTISGGGLYTAPANAPSPATLRVTVTSVADPTKSASANITVVVATAILMSISPATASVPTAGNESFTATVSGTQNTAVAWSLTGAGCSGAACGTLATSSLTAVYTAPGVAPTPPSVSVMASSMAEPGKTASAIVTIVPVVSVTVTPATVSLATGATQQFSASIVGSSNTAVMWSVQGTGCSGAACGTISGAGLYTAPSAVPSPATVTVTATSSADSTKAASATVAIFSASSTNTTNGLTIPATHPRLLWTPARIATAKAWVASAKYPGLNTASPRPLDDYDMAFSCFIMNVSGACTQVISDAMAFAPSGTNGTGAGDDNMRRNGEWIMLVRDWLYPGCGKAQCLTSAQVATIDSNWSLWQSNQDNVIQTWGNVGMPANNYFAGQFRNDFDFGIASYGENTNAGANLQYGVVNRWNDLLNFVSPTGTGKNGTHGYALHSQEGGGEYGRYSLDYYALPLATSALLGRDMWTETTAFKSGVFQTIYNTMPAMTTSRSMWDMFTWGDDENWAGGANCGYQSHNGPDGHGGCGASSQYYGDFMQAAANEFPNTAVGKLARQWISTVNPAIGPIFLSVNPGGSSQAYSTMPLDYYSSGAQYMYSHSDWTSSGTSMLWQMGIYNGDNVGTTQSWGGGHSHQDAGTFQVFRKGVNIIRETAAYSETVTGYNGSGTVDAATGFAHNIPLLGGQASINVFGGCSDGPGIVKRLETQPGYSFAVTDLTLTYQNNVCDSSHPERENPYAASVVREYYFLRGINTIVIVDRLQTDVATRSTTFVSHCEKSPTVTATTVACIDGAQEALYTALAPASPTIAVVAENANGGTAANWQYRIEANNANPGNVVSYNIYTIQLGDASGFNAMTPGIADSSPGNPTSGTFTITLDANDSIVINKGIASSGGTIKAAGTTKSLATGVQTMTITDSGPAWQ
jgi:Fe-S cluster assembly iron-binding protein IscA